MNDTHRCLFNDSILELKQNKEKNSDVNKFISYVRELEEKSKLQNTVNKTSAVWEYLLICEKAINEMNGRIGEMEQKIKLLEKQTASRKYYASSYVNRKEIILKTLEQDKFLNIDKVKQLLGLKSTCYVRQIMKEIAEGGEVAFVAGTSRTSSKLVSKNFTFQEIKDWLLAEMPLRSSMLVSRFAELFFVPEEKLPALVRSLSPQFRCLNWKTGLRVERIK